MCSQLNGVSSILLSGLMRMIWVLANCTPVQATELSQVIPHGCLLGLEENAAFS